MNISNIIDKTLLNEANQAIVYLESGSISGSALKELIASLVASKQKNNVFFKDHSKPKLGAFYVIKLPSISLADIAKTGKALIAVLENEDKVVKNLYWSPISGTITF